MAAAPDSSSLHATGDAPPHEGVQPATDSPSRAARFGRYARPTPGGHSPVLAAPTRPARVSGRQVRAFVRNTLVLAVIATLALLLGLSWQRSTALEAEVAALSHDAEVSRTHESELNTVLRLQKDKLSGQDAQIQSTGQDMQTVQRELQDLRDRMARLDQHNAELRGALGLTEEDGAITASPTPTTTLTPGPTSLAPGPEGGESGPLYTLLLAPPLATPNPNPPDLIANFRDSLADLNHSLDIYEQIEDELTNVAAQRMQEWAQMDEDDDTEAPPQVAEDKPPPPADDGGAGKPPVKKPPAAVSHVPSGYPYYGLITSPFGWRSSPFVQGKVGFHKGLDIKAPMGTPVHATQTGIVSQAGWSDVYGRMVMIDHGAGWSTLYGHNSKLLVSVGQRVVKGQVIAYSGSTGMSTGPHIHYEVRRNGVPVNPANYR
ncbi:MAG TPA: M23 family metallopeptidase [Chloroflexia bacterium]